MSAPGRTSVRDEHVTVWAVLAGLLALAGLVGTIWRPFAPRVAAVATDLDRFDPGVLAAVEDYRSPRLILVVIATLVPVVVPLLAVVSPWGRRLVTRLAGSGAPGRRAALVALVISLATAVATLPIAAWLRLVHDGRWGFRTQSALAWLGDWTLVTAGRSAMVALAVGLAVVAARRWPRSWPYRATVAATGVAVLGVLLHPVVLLPVTLPTEPMSAAQQRGTIDDVLEAAGERQLPVYVAEESRRSTRVNALATGIGPTARVVVYDNLLELPDDQVASVVAHEVAHHQHRDLLRGVLLVATAALPALLVLRRVTASGAVRRRCGARVPADPRLIGAVLVVVAVLELGARPVLNAVSRNLEAAADARAMEITGDPSTLVASTRVFTVRDLADPDPPAAIRILYRTHPSVGERVRQAVAIADRDGVALPSREDIEAAEAGQRHPASGEAAS